MMLLRRLLAGSMVAAGLVLPAMAGVAQTISGGVTSAGGVYNAQLNAYESANTSAQFNNASVNNNAAQTSFLANTGVVLGYQPGITVDFAFSDAVLTSAQINAWPRTFNGNLVQLPSFGTPVTVPFNLPGKSANGALALSDAQMCGIFSGRLTDWSQVAGSGASGAISVIFRADDSGTTYLLTQRLAYVCDASNSNIVFQASNSFSSQFKAGVPSNFLGVGSPAGVAATIENVPLSIGYVTPDLTRIAPAQAGNTTLPFVASVDGVLPTSLNTSTALSTVSAPSTFGAVNDTQAFVPQIPTPRSGYPIVGFETIDISQCYKDANVGNSIADYLGDLYSDPPYENLITQSGFSVVPSTLSNAILNNIYNNNNNYNADIQNATVCTAGKGR